LAVLVTAIIATVRARPRTVAGAAIAGSLVMPTMALILGTKFGIDMLTHQLQEEAARLGSDAARALRETLAENGIETNALIDLLLRILG
jgi:NADP-dependent 3-hydroxy acid dehydrogenase YdfG